MAIALPILQPQIECLTQGLDMMSGWKRVWVGAMLCASAAMAHAGLSSQDLVAPGDALLTVDSQSGLAWLDLSETRGRSFNETLAGPWLALGFRLATRDDVRGLLAAGGQVGEQPFLSLLGGVPAPEDVSTLLGGPTLMLAGIVGGDANVPEAPLPLWTLYETRDTQLSSGSGLGAGDIGSTISDGEAAYGSGGVTSVVIGSLQPSSAPSLGTYIRLREAAMDPWQTQADAGVFLVREVAAVPEPGSVWLMGLGLAALSGAVRRRAA